MSYGIKCQDTHICYLHERNVKYKHTYEFKNLYGKKIYYGKSNNKKVGIVTLLSDKVDCKEHYQKQNGYFIMVRGQSFRKLK